MKKYLEAGRLTSARGLKGELRFDCWCDGPEFLSGVERLYLDEIGEMDIALQVKILRALQEKEIERVGGSGSKKVNVRIVAATNRDLEQEVKAGRFREDLYYRLNVIPLHLPPLRDRGQDILLLCEHFLKRFCERRQRQTLTLSANARKVLSAYSWPGNVRELENFMERLSILCDNPIVQVEDLPEKILCSVGEIEPLPEELSAIEKESSKTEELPRVSGNETFRPPDLEDMFASKLGLKEFLESMEDRLLMQALERADGVKNQAAEILGIKRTTLIEKLKKKRMD